MSEERKSIKAGKLVNKNPDKRLLLTIKEQSVKTEHIADGAITSQKVSPDAIEYITADVQNQIDSIQIGGWAISNQLGNDPHIGISQKALTDLIGYDNIPETIRGRIQEVENEIGTDTTSDSLSGRITNLENAVGTGGSIDTRISTAKSDIIGTASSDYDTLGETENKIKDEVTNRTNAVNTLDGRISSIEPLIPLQATSSNQLADKNFVTSSISTATATFKGTFNNLAELQEVTSADANDYAYVISTDSAGNTLYNRYKFVGGGIDWVFEYALNNSSFTAQEWATIESGMTEALTTKLSALPDNAILQNTLTTLSNTDISLGNRITTLETNVGEGGSVDARIDLAKAQIIGDADTNYNTLGKLEYRLQEEITARINAVSAEATARESAVSMEASERSNAILLETTRALAAEELLRQAYEAISQFEPIIGTLPSSGVTGKVYRVPGTTSYSDYMWNGSQFVKMAEYDNAIDDKPTAGSDNLVKSGGVSEFKSYNYTKNDYTNSLVKEIHIDGNYDANLKYFIRSCRRRRNIGTYPDSFYFAIQSYDPVTEEITTICEFGSTENIERSGVYTSTNGNYTTTILLTLENQTDNTGSIYLHDYDASLEINDICWGDIKNAPIINIINSMSPGNTDFNIINLHKYHESDIVSSDDIYTIFGEIPVSDRKTPCMIAFRFGVYYRFFIYRSKSRNGSVIDEYWTNPSYWNEIIDSETFSQQYGQFKSYNFTKNEYVNSMIKELHIDGPKDPNLRYFVRSCLKKGRPQIGTGDRPYFAIQSYNPSTEERVTICEFEDNATSYESALMRKSGVYIDVQSVNNVQYKTYILLNVNESDTNEGGFLLAAYSEDLEIKDNSWGDLENAPIIAQYLREHETSCKHVDLIMFMGQSNMAGRGVTNVNHPEKAPVIYGDIGYEFRAISDPTKLYPISEPFGFNENLPSGIDDGTKKTGSMVSAFALAYYATCKSTIVGVSASKGGTTSSHWQPTGILLPDAIQRLADAVTYLTNNNYHIDHKYMLWCQGESDGDEGKTANEYKANFMNIFNAMKDNGIEKCFIVRIGKYNGSGTTDYSTIINAQTDLCRENEDIIMASTALASFKDKGLMKDDFHYYQDAYNLVGTYAGRNVGLYRRYGIGKPQYDVMTDSLFFSDKDY